MKIYDLANTWVFFIGYLIKQLGNRAKKSSFAKVYCQYFSVLSSEKVFPTP